MKQIIRMGERRPKMRGCFRMKIFRNGRLIETFEDHNLIVSGAKESMARLLAGEGTGRNITSIAFGTSGDVPIPDDTEITAPFVKPLSGHSYTVTDEEGYAEVPADAPLVEFQWNLLNSEANGKAISEFGLLCADGTLFARRTRQLPLNKLSDIALEGYWIIYF
jgi:hypothetical protein